MSYEVIAIGASWGGLQAVGTLLEGIPQQLDQTPLSVFLPATILATTWSPITIAADLSVVNNFAARMK